MISLINTNRLKEHLPPRNKLKKDHRVYGDIPSRCGADDSPHGAEGQKAISASCTTQKDTCNQEGRVERGLPADQVAGDTPERSTKNQACIVGHRTVADLDDTGKFEFNRRLDAADAL